MVGDTVVTNPHASFPAGREVVGTHPVPGAYIPVYLTMPGYRFTRSAGLKME